MAQKETYSEIIARAKRLNLDEARALGILDLPDTRGADARPIVALMPGVLDLQRLHDRNFVDRLKCYLLLQLDSVSKQEYNVILFATKMKWSHKLFMFLFSEVGVLLSVHRPAV